MWANQVVNLLRVPKPYRAAVLQVVKTLVTFARYSDQRERAHAFRAVARVGWRHCRPRVGWRPPVRAGGRFCRPALVFAAVCCLLGGCGGSGDAPLDDYLEGLDFAAPVESGVAIPVGGRHSISIAAKEQVAGQGEKIVWVQLRFRLFVVVEPEHEAVVLAATQRHVGLIQDTVMKVCRKLTLEELKDHRHTLLKTHLIDALRPLLGQNRIQQLVINDDSWEAI